MENRFTYVKVGFLAMVGFFLIIGMFSWKSGIVSRYEDYEISGKFFDVGGLMESSDVRYRGYIVGKVVDITPKSKHIDVSISVRKDVSIPADSTLRIAFDGLIGQKYMNIIPGVSENILQNGDVIRGMSAAEIVDFIDEGSRSMAEFQAMIRHFNDLLETNELQNNISKSVSNFAETTEKLSKISTDLGKITGKIENRENFEIILKNIRDITDDLSKKGVKLRIF